MVVASVARYFTPDEYQDQGYQNAITITEDVYSMQSGYLVEAYKWVSQAKIRFFDFKWIDTGALTFYDYSTVLINFEPDGETSRTK